MGEAITRCLIDQKIFQPQNIWITEPEITRQDYLRSRYAATVCDFPKKDSEILLLAIKPQTFDMIATSLADTGAELVISIMAGISFERLEAGFLTQATTKAIFRAMPNTPAQVGAGITAIASGKSVEPCHKLIVAKIFAAVGEVIEVPESWLDAVTGLSGSGPGYVALIIEAMADGGVAAGLPRAIAIKLAIQTVLGTSQMLKETGLHPAQLKDQVTSAGGTTIAGISQLEKSGVRSGIIEAVVAAARRAKELGS